MVKKNKRRILLSDCTYPAESKRCQEKQTANFFLIVRAYSRTHLSTMYDEGKKP